MNHVAGPADVATRLPAVIAAGESIDGDGLPGMVHHSPRQRDDPLWQVPMCGTVQVAAAVARARTSFQSLPRAGRIESAAWLDRLGRVVEAETAALVRQLAIEIGKPLRDARGEVAFTVKLLDAATRQAVVSAEAERGMSWQVRRRPHGVVAIVTPWNNSLAIPLGKLAPALLYGNAVVWKPAPPGAGVAVKVMQLLEQAGVPPGLVQLINGDGETSRCLMNDRVDAVSLTGSLAAGACGRAICARRGVPFQGELGGNNAAIVWSDADLPDAARQLAAGAFGSAGQRCTANRRVVVDQRCYDAFLELLHEATAALAWGDPLDESTQVGPLVSDDALRRVADLVERAREARLSVSQPHASLSHAEPLQRSGCYFPPTLVCCDDADAEVVQEETFGPVLVIQRARDWDEAINLCNGVRQGLVAAVFSGSTSLQRRFLSEAQAGILKINLATSGVEADAPFGGWKESGHGPPEHGCGDLLFYTRPQTVYGAPQADDWTESNPT